MVKKKNLWYYKCNKIGCRCNKSARHLHSKFEDMLDYYAFDRMYIRWLPRDPFLGYKMAKREVIREALSQEEIDALTNKKA